jgi:hypothetical protein
MKHLFPGLHSVSVICAGVGWRTRHDEGRVLVDILWVAMPSTSPGFTCVCIKSDVCCLEALPKKPLSKKETLLNSMKGAF